MAEDWSAHEVAAIVGDYRTMLRLELLGQSYNKAEHNRRLRVLLDSRSKASVEFKHANISAVLIELDFPPLAGYKRRLNVQSLLREEVRNQLAADLELQLLAKMFVSAPAAGVALGPSLDRIRVPAPTREPQSDRIYSRPASPREPRLGFDYLAQEARNASLGLAGEKFVLEYEHRTLREAGAKRLAERIEHVAQTRGDGLGYDILSFEPDGRERLIEVKTTGLGMTTPFYASRREVAASEELAEHFHLYRVFKYRVEPKLFVLSGSMRETCLLDPVQYSASPI